MKSAGSSLITYLNSKQATDAELLWFWLFTVTLTNGTVFRWTNCDQDITVGGHTYLSGDAPTIHVGKVRQVSGVELCEMDIAFGITRLNGGGAGGYATLPLAALNGVFDNATIEADKLFMQYPGDVSLGVLTYFSGIVSKVKPSSTRLAVNIKGSKQLLKTLQWPKRRLFPQCPYSLYDTNCGVVKSAISATVQTLATPTVVTVSGLSHGTYTLGTIAFADGEVRQIQSMAPSGSNDVLTLNFPLTTTPAASSSASVLLGCNKSLYQLNTNSGNCTTLGGQFGGYPYVPRPESIR